MLEQELDLSMPEGREVKGSYRPPVGLGRGSGEAKPADGKLISEFDIFGL